MLTGCASNPWPSSVSPASCLCPAELTHHFLAALAYHLPRQEGVLSVGLFFILEGQDLWGPLLAHQLGWPSPISDSLQFKAVSHPSMVKYSMTGYLPSRLTLPLTVSPSMDAAKYQSSTFSRPTHL